MTPAQPTPAPVKAIIFDCDGTLVDSETSGMTALYEEACALGYSLPLELALRDFRGKRMALCIALIEGNLGRPAPAAYFSDRGRLFQADRGRRFRAIVDAQGCAQARV